METVNPGYARTDVKFVKMILLWMAARNNRAKNATVRDIAKIRVKNAKNARLTIHHAYLIAQNVRNVTRLEIVLI